jgi:hypothetical protein
VEGALEVAVASVAVGERDIGESVGARRLVSAGRFWWMPVCADEGRSVVVDGEGRDGDLWAERWHSWWLREAQLRGRRFGV